MELLNDGIKQEPQKFLALKMSKEISVSKEICVSPNPHYSLTDFLSFDKFNNKLMALNTPNISANIFNCTILESICFVLFHLFSSNSRQIVLV